VPPVDGWEQIKGAKSAGQRRHGEQRERPDGKLKRRSRQGAAGDGFELEIGAGLNCQQRSRQQCKWNKEDGTVHEGTSLRLPGDRE
jgi:hypothetical protein